MTTINITTNGVPSSDQSTNYVTNLGSNNNNLQVNMLGTYETLIIGNGNDNINVGSGNDTVITGSGHDNITITGSSTITSSDILNLGSGTDSVFATGDVNLNITATNTHQATINLSGSTGMDSFSGGNGSYNINYGHNSGSITVGNGNNTITDGNTTDSLSLSLGDGTNTIKLGNGMIDVVTIGNGNNNSLTIGNGLVDVATVGDGNHDSVVMGTGQDFVTMGNGNYDYVSLGDGNNTVVMGSGLNNQVFLGNGSNYVDAGAGSDTVIAGNGGATGNMFIYEAQPHPLVTVTNHNGCCYNSCGNSYNCGSNSCYDNSPNYGYCNPCNNNFNSCGGNFNSCGNNNYNSCGSINYNTCGSDYNSCGSYQTLSLSDYSYYSGGGNLNTLEINMTNAQYQSYLTYDSSHFSYSIPHDYTFTSIPLIINNMTNIIFNEINTGANTDTAHFISAPSGQVFVGSEGTNTLDYSGILPSTHNIGSEVLHVDLGAGLANLANTSDVAVGQSDTVLNFNNVIGAQNTFANEITISNLMNGVDGGHNQLTHDTALHGLVLNNLISNNELDLSGLTGNINIASAGAGTHGSWTDIGTLNLGANTSLTLDTAGVASLEQKGETTLVINSSSASAGNTTSVTATDFSVWTKLAQTVTGTDVNGLAHNYNVYTHGAQTLLIDQNIHTQTV